MTLFTSLIVSIATGPLAVHRNLLFTAQLCGVTVDDAKGHVGVLTKKSMAFAECSHSNQIILYIRIRLCYRKHKIAHFQRALYYFSIAHISLVPFYLNI